MLLIQIDGTPTAAAAPASTPKTWRRVMGTGDHEGRERANDMGRYMACAGSTWNLRQDLLLVAKRPIQKCNNSNGLCGRRGHFGLVSLDFDPFPAFNPRTSRKDVLFDPPPGP